MPNPTDRAGIGQTDLNVTRLSLGTAPIGNLLQEVPEADAEGAFKAAFSAGLRYVDTAPFYGYGLAENRVGRALADQNRDDFVVSTKVGRLIRPGRRTGTEIYNGDKSFYLAHPAIATILTGVRSATDFEENERLFRHPIPDAMWQELKAAGLLAEEAPVPNDEEKTK